MINEIMHDGIELNDIINGMSILNDKSSEKDQLHKWLEELRIYRNQLTFNKQPNKDKSIYLNSTIQILDHTFGMNDISFTHTDKSTLIHLGVAIIEISEDSMFNNVITCFVSFYESANVVVVAEIINTLKGVFGNKLIINQDTYIVDDITNKYIWGDDKTTIKRRNGVLVPHSIVFTDNAAGHA